MRKKINLKGTVAGKEANVLLMLSDTFTFRFKKSNLGIIDTQLILATYFMNLFDFEDATEITFSIAKEDVRYLPSSLLNKISKDDGVLLEVTFSRFDLLFSCLCPPAVVEDYSIYSYISGAIDEPLHFYSMKILSSSEVLSKVNMDNEARDSQFNVYQGEFNVLELFSNWDCEDEWSNTKQVVDAVCLKYNIEHIVFHNFDNDMIETTIGDCLNRYSNETMEYRYETLRDRNVLENHGRGISFAKIQGEIKLLEQEIIFSKDKLSLTKSDEEIDYILDEINVIKRSIKYKENKIYLAKQFATVA